MPRFYFSLLWITVIHGISEMETTGASLSYRPLNELLNAKELIVSRQAERCRLVQLLVSFCMRCMPVTSLVKLCNQLLKLSLKILLYPGAVLAVWY